MEGRLNRAVQAEQLYLVWNAGWKAADFEAKRSKGVANILNYMNLKPTDTDTYSSEHHHKDQ